MLLIEAQVDLGKRKMRNELNILEEYEKLHWMQKFRNTKFFHAIKRECLKNIDDIWVEEPQDHETNLLGPFQEYFLLTRHG